jgi:hypothetical protein
MAKVSKGAPSIKSKGMKYKKVGEEVKLDDKVKKEPEAKKAGRPSGWLAEGVVSTIDAQGEKMEVTADMAKMAPDAKAKKSKIKGEAHAPAKCEKDGHYVE